jgi:hypothetical protein
MPQITDNPNQFISALSSIAIEKDEEIFHIVSAETSGSGESMLKVLSFEENLSTGYMTGYIEVVDRNDWVGQMNIVGGEKIIIKFGYIDLPVNQSPVELKFTIVSSKIINDFANVNELRYGVADKHIVYRMEFMSSEFFDKIFSTSFLNLDKDFIGYISIGSDEEEQSGSNQNKIPGLINELSLKLGLSPVEIEGTKNGIWLKHKDISYPTGVNQGQIDIMSLIKFVTNYSVSKINTNAVNFCFWQDRDGWHFKSIEKILQEQSENESPPTFDLNTDDLQGPEQKLSRVISVSITNQNDLLSLTNSRAFYSHYISQKPNYNDPYFDFMSSIEGFTYSIVDYDYHRDFAKVNHVEQYKLIPEDVDTGSILNKKKKITKPSRLATDSVWGFYELNTLNNPFESGIHYSADRGFGAKPDNPKIVWWDYVDRKEDSRWSNIAWQPQFDITELEIKKLHLIQTKIREPLEDKRKEFVKMKNLKRRWEVYRCVVCCFNGFDYGIKDKQQLESLQSIGSACGFTGNLGCINPAQLGISGDVYNFLFGENGIYKGNEEYRVVAAGSFTDLLDYDKENECIQHGLTLSVNLDSPNIKTPAGVLDGGTPSSFFNPNVWLKQTIGEFYNLDRNITKYKNNVLQRGINQYNQVIQDLQDRKTSAQQFIANVSSYITQADQWITDRLLPCCYPYPRVGAGPAGSTTPGPLNGAGGGAGGGGGGSSSSLQAFSGVECSDCDSACCVNGFCSEECEPEQSFIDSCCFGCPPASFCQCWTCDGGKCTSYYRGLEPGFPPKYLDCKDGDFSDRVSCVLSCQEDSLWYVCPGSGSCIAQSFPSSQAPSFKSLEDCQQYSQCGIGECTFTHKATLNAGGVELPCKCLCEEDQADWENIIQDHITYFLGNATIRSYIFNQNPDWDGASYTTNTIPIGLGGCYGCANFDNSGACCEDCPDPEPGGNNVKCACLDGYTYQECAARANTLGDPNRTTFYKGLSCFQINYCKGGTGSVQQDNYDLCEEGTGPCLREGCTDTLTGSVFSREPSACVGFNYVDGLGNVPLITLPEGMCRKCNNFVETNADKEFDQINCCNCTANEAKTYSPLPGWVKTCSGEKFMKKLIQYLGSESNWYFNYRYTPGGGSAFSDADDYIGPNDYGDRQTTLDCIANGDCYNVLCFNPLYLEVEKRRAEEEIKVIDAEIKLLEYSRNIFQTNFITTFNQNYEEWWNRKSFFYSKIPGKNVFTDLSTGIPGSIKNGRLTPISTPKSLYNIKTIKRKPIRGSRYELLARNRGVTGANVGSWLYNFFFANSSSGGSRHPYYTQTYDANSFKTQRKLYRNYLYNNSNPYNDFPFTSQYSPANCGNLSSYFTEKSHISLPIDQVLGGNLFSVDQLAPQTQYDLNINTNPSDYSTAYDIFSIGGSSIPPNLKNEQLSSYVRIEFESPIGLESIQDFPDSFVRDAGTEYFLPYLVSLTPGPTGRQTVRNNIAVIGQDPYGFDVAIKKSNVSDEETDKQWAWWDDYRNLNDTSLSNNGMDLWPEVGFETAFPYYTTDPKGWWWNNGWYHGEGGKGNDAFKENVNNYDWYTRSADVDPEYKESAHGSGYLQYSHKRIKPHRSWWSFHIPKNIFIPQDLFHILSVKFGEIENGENSGIIGDLMGYKWKDYVWWYGSDLDRWLRLTPTGRAQLSGLKVLSAISDANRSDYAKVHDSNNIGGAGAGWFYETTMNWMKANFLLYRPGLVTEDVWKYDLSGESDYGMVSPPTMKPNYDLFDNNFSAQFLVFTRKSKICEGFVCANPEAPIGYSGCPQNDPYCNCPCKDKKPKEPEPSYIDLFCKWQELKECELIKTVLGEEYLGCVWSDPDAPCSCICPCQNSKFKEYLEYNRTYSNFWDTPLATPLNRVAQMTQMSAQQMSIMVPYTSIPKVGMLIKTNHYGAISPSLPKQEKNTHGKWLITAIKHLFHKDNSASMVLVLNRDTAERPPEYITPGLEALYKEMVEYG